MALVQGPKLSDIVAENALRQARQQPAAAPPSLGEVLLGALKGLPGAVVNIVKLDDPQACRMQMAVSESDMTPIHLKVSANGVDFTGLVMPLGG